MGFRIHVIIRATIGVIFGSAGVYLLLATSYWLLALWMLLGLVISIASLIKYVERNHRDMTNFLWSIRQNDFTNTFPSSTMEADKNWHGAFNAINSKFRELRSEKQSNYHFLQAVVEHTGVPLVCYKQDTEEVTIINEAAKTLFQKPFLSKVSSLSAVDKELPGVLLSLDSGKQELRSVKIGKEIVPLSIIARELVLEGQAFKLIAFHNIKNELEEKELESWQKLIRVLTHEIKNSAIPISTLTEVIDHMIVDEEGQLKDLNHFTEEEVDDLKNGLQTVTKRSKGLVSFVNAFGQMSKLPKPNLQPVDVDNLLTNIKTLFAKELEQQKVTFQVATNSTLTLSADREMVEQVIINLVKNAKEALIDKPKAEINVSAYTSEQTTVIEVTDNGIGMDKEALDNIFVPFYTTKKEGSGIGLSLSRQIMQLHGGKLSVQSEEGTGTSFYLQF